MDNRRGNYVPTASGRIFWPLDPHVEEVDLYDIATGLSRINRWGGATRIPYTVAQHCMYVADEVVRMGAPEQEAAALLHDAAEAYIGDLTRPLKVLPEFAAYKVIEEGIERVVALRFQLEYPWHPAIKAADEAVGTAEALQIISMEPELAAKHYTGKPADIVITAMREQRVVRRMYIERVVAALDRR